MMDFFTFRAATYDDARLLYEWRNDSLTRAMSHQTQQESYENHLLWLENSLKNPKRSIYICENHAQPIGTIRLDQREISLEMSWTLAPFYRGKGLGKKMLLQFIQMHPQTYLAQVKKENIASQKMCEAAGFKLIQEKEGLLFYQKK